MKSRESYRMKTLGTKKGVQKLSTSSKKNKKRWVTQICQQFGKKEKENER